jgi:membrane-associated protease RseP (regulator of RpoE activity)
MKAHASLLALILVASLHAGAMAQPALDRLERQLWGNGPARAAADASPAREPGYLGMLADDRADQGRGVRVVEVLADGPAARAGLQPGDLIVRAGDQPIRMMSDLAAIIERSLPGDSLVLAVERGQVEQKLTATFGRRPPPEQRRFQAFGQVPQQGLRAVPANPAPVNPAVPANPLEAPRGAVPNAPAAGVTAEQLRIEQLERRIAELERRLLLLEQALGRQR